MHTAVREQCASFDADGFASAMRCAHELDRVDDVVSQVITPQSDRQHAVIGPSSRDSRA